jgi:NTP pyrophosphatase (non-canonical NTP hydrolase)
MSAKTISSLQQEIDSFATERDWNQFHTRKNLPMALAGECGELIEHFQWLTPEESFIIPREKAEQISDELADILIYLLRLCQAPDIDPVEAGHRKMQKNRIKYPAEQVKGRAKKYSEY